MPREFVNTDPSATPVTGAAWTVSEGGDLQAALDRANPGDEIVLMAGATFTGNFILRNKGGHGWITIRSSASNNLPVGTRVDPAARASMASIITPNSQPAFATEPGAHQYRMLGLEITVAPATPLNYGLFFTAVGTEMNLNQIPTDIIIDRCYMHGEILCHCKSGLQLNAVRGAVVDSYLADFHGIGQDTQAILSYSTPGPLKFLNDYLEGAAENLLFGGAYSALPNLTMSDIEVRNCTLSKPLSWQNSIIPPPANVTVTLGPGGNVTPGQYWYSLVAFGVAGYYTATTGGFSGLSHETMIAVIPGQQSVSLSWSSVAYGDAADARTADSYAIVRSSQPPGTTNRAWEYVVVQPTGTGTQSAVDNGQLFTSWPISTWWQLPGGVKWEVKNNFECKNCQRLIAEGNTLIGNWQDGQNGVSVLLTPRVETQTSLPPMYSNRVQDVTFVNNTIAHTAGGFSLLGYDYNQCVDKSRCQQTSRILLANNLMYDVSQTYGQYIGYGWLFSSGEPGGATNVIIDHNTSLNDGNSIEDDNPEGSLIMTNNIMPRGIHAGGMGPAIQVFSEAFLPGIFIGNLYVGASSSETPPGNLLPPTMQDVGFTNTSSGNYKLLLHSPYSGSATDGSDPGVNMDVLNAASTVRFPSCAYVVSPAGLSFPATGGTLPVTVQTDPACGWLAESGATWAQISSPFATLGSGTVYLTAPPNRSGAIRSSSIQVAHQLIPISQPAQPSCEGLSLTPLFVSLTGAAQQGTLVVSAPSQCSWVVTSEPWIAITSGSSGTGNGLILFSVTAETGAPRVGALSVNGQIITFSQAVDVPTAVTVGNPTPANGANNVSSPVLSWSSSGGSPFQIYFGSTGILPLVGTSNIPTFTLPQTLAANTTYYWQVQTANAWSPSWSFTTSASGTASQPPVTPVTLTSPTPSNGATNVSPKVLSWISSGAATYQIYFGTSGTLPLAGTTTSSGFNLSASLSPSTTYYWQVQATTTTGKFWSPKWSFTTPDLPPIPPVTVSGPAPANGTAGVSPTVLSWTSSGATSYQVYFGQNATGTLPLAGTTTSTNFGLNTSLSPNTTYYWQVQAIASASNAWSPIWSFMTPASITPPGGLSGALFVPVAPCRLVDTRNASGPFGGPAISGNTSRDFPIPDAGCGIPSGAIAYAMNVTAVPHGRLGILQIWQTGGSRPVASLLNSYDGRYKAVATIVPAGTGGAVSVFVTDTSDVVLDISGYFVPASASTGAAFYPLAPCRLVDTRLATGLLGGPFLAADISRTLPIATSDCGLPAAVSAYSLNITVVPHGSLGFVTVWPSGVSKPWVSTLNAPTGAIVANAAIVPAGVGGSIDVFANGDTDLVVDLDGYFAPPGPGGLSLYPVAPCRVLDTRVPSGSPSWRGTISVSSGWFPCGVSDSARAVIINATVVPPGPLGYLTLWPAGTGRPGVSTLNALDATVTSNMAIVPSANDAINVFASDPTQLVVDISGYFAP